MRAFLEIVAGPYAGKVVQLDTGEMCRVGRAARVELPLFGDEQLSPIHFAVACGVGHCQLHDLNSWGGTYRNGAKVHQAVLSSGDQIVAGQTVLNVYLDEVGGSAVEASTEGAATGEAAADGGDPEGPAPLRHVLKFLREQPQHLFALLDAAREPRIPELLEASGEEYRCLYEGESADALASVAPYLARVPPSSALLETLVGRGWGRSWGYFLACGEPLATVRGHLRRLQFVEDEEGESLYFRFYDPRVLRVFLPTCTPAEAEHFFGPVEAFYAEAQSPLTLLELTAGDSRQVSLTGAAL